MEKIQIEWIRKCFIQEIYLEMDEKKKSKFKFRLID